MQSYGYSVTDRYQNVSAITAERTLVQCTASDHIHTYTNIGIHNAHINAKMNITVIDWRLIVLICVCVYIVSLHTVQWLCVDKVRPYMGKILRYAARWSQVALTGVFPHICGCVVHQTHIPKDKHTAFRNPHIHLDTWTTACLVLRLRGIVHI